MIRLILLLIFLIIYFIISIPIQLAELIIEKFNMDLRNRSSLAIVNWALKCVAFLSGIKLEVNGYENIPNDQAVLFVGNHRGIFDVIVTYPLMKRPTGYIAKKEIARIPFLNWWMYFVNCVFLDRKNPREGLRAINKASEMIKSGISMFIFPEGTRTKDGKLHDFKEGSLKIATKSKCPIVPVGINGTSDVFERQIPLIRSAKVTVSFGKPLYTADMSRDELKAITQTVQNEVANLIE